MARSQGMKKEDRRRSYRALMYGLAEENRICPLPPDELRKRQRKIYEDCFGGDIKRVVSYGRDRY
ncbi:MAG: hypothetical protein WCF47_16510 [Pseudolabrys sp.]